MTKSATRSFADELGIDDNATSTAVTIDASENVMVGKTTIAGAFNTVGSEIRASGLVQSTVDGSKCIDLNRLSSDGDILGFSKAGTSVGSIGTYLNASYIMGSGSKGIFLNGTLNPAGASGGIDDNTQNIGASNRRWKDLYLSGGVYLGGTGAANKLDDYEQSAFTPSVRDAASGSNSQVLSGTFKYTKIGRLVHFQIDAANIVTSGLTGANRLYITGLPFTASYTSVCPVWHQYVDGPASSVSGGNIVGRVIAGSSYIILDGTRGGTADQAVYVNDLTSGSSDIRLAGSYMTS